VRLIFNPHSFCFLFSHCFSFTSPLGFPLFLFHISSLFPTVSLSHLLFVSHCFSFTSPLCFPLFLFHISSLLPTVSLSHLLFASHCFSFTSPLCFSLFSSHFLFELPTYFGIFTIIKVQFLSLLSFFLIFFFDPSLAA